MTHCDVFLTTVIVAMLFGLWLGDELICSGIQRENIKREVVGILVMGAAAIVGVVVMMFVIGGRLRVLCAL